MKRRIFAAVAVGGATGLVAAFIQTLEKLRLLERSGQALSCDLNSVFSCTNVLNSWQSSLFGFPNSLMCMAFFTLFMTVGLVGLSGGTLVRAFRVSVQALALFVLGFGLWFLWQSVYVIGSLCLLCLFCFGGLLLVNWALLRINARDLPIGSRGRAQVQSLINKGADTFAWLLLAMLIAFVMIAKFA